MLIFQHRADNSAAHLWYVIVFGATSRTKSLITMDFSIIHGESCEISAGM
jgi:hypothetical protein